MTAENPVVETTRPEGATRIDAMELQAIPNNGRNFLEFTKLTPGVSIVQGPDGDELTVNGQKGIQNNVSVDGADFNNPFFGEQRGGQRPAFTFNLDAVQEVVVIADGANAEYGRSSSGFVNVVTKSGTNAFAGTVNLFYKDDSLASAAKNPDGSSSEKFDSDQLQGGFTLGGPIAKDKVFFVVALDAQGGDSTKQTDPNRIEQRVVDYFASVGSPDENGPIDRTNDALVGLAKMDWFINPKHTATIRGTYTKSSQENGTFDVDSWGRSANAIEDNWSKSLTGTLISNFNTTLNEFRFQFAREDRPRPYNGPNISGQSRPLPDTAFDFAKGYRFGEPFFIPVDYYDTRFQINDNVTFLTGPPRDQGRFRVQPGQRDAGLPRLRERPVHLQLHGRFPELREEPELRRVLRRLVEPERDLPGGDDGHRTGAPLPAAGGRRGPDRRGGRDAVDPPGRAGGLHPGQVAAGAEPDDPVRHSAGRRRSSPTRSRRRTRSSTRRSSARPQRAGVPVGRDDPVRQEHVAAAARHHVGPDEGRQDGRPGQRRDSTTPASRACRSRRPARRTAARGQSLYRDSSLTGILGAVPAYPNLVPASEVGTPVPAGDLRTSTRTSRTRRRAAQRRRGRGVFKDYGSSSSTTTRRRRT